MKKEEAESSKWSASLSFSQLCVHMTREDQNQTKTRCFKKPSIITHKPFAYKFVLPCFLSTYSHIYQNHPFQTRASRSSLKSMNFCRLVLEHSSLYNLCVQWFRSLDLYNLYYSLRSYMIVCRFEIDKV